MWRSGSLWPGRECCVARMLLSRVSFFRVGPEGRCQHHQTLSPASDLLLHWDFSCIFRCKAFSIFLLLHIFSILVSPHFSAPSQKVAPGIDLRFCTSSHPHTFVSPRRRQFLQVPSRRGGTEGRTFFGLRALDALRDHGCKVACCRH